MQRRTAYHLYIDESGTHDLKTVDAGYPVFVLVGLLVGELYYARTVVPRVRALKVLHGIPTSVPFHSRDIRRQEGPFRFLADAARRTAFYEDLNRMYVQLRIRLFAVVIRKAELVARYLLPEDPYFVSMSQLLSAVCGPPRLPGPWRPNVSRIVAERRGKREDKALQAEYQRLRASGLPSYGATDVQTRRPTTVTRLFPARVDFVSKDRVVAGLELADLAAYPIGHAVARHDLAHPSFRVVQTKLRHLVVFP